VTALPTIAALLLALGGPPLLTIVSAKVLGESQSVVTLLPFDLLMWALLGVILVIVVFVERKPVSSIGLATPRWSTLAWGLLLALVVTFVLAPLVTAAMGRFGLPGYERGLRPLLALPAWYRVLLAVTAGAVEEPLYRGYAVERLAWLTGSYWRGGLIAVVAFGLAHIPGWGIGPALVALLAGVVQTLFYVWKRDLLANIIAHAIGDIVGLVLLPPGSS